MRPNATTHIPFQGDAKTGGDCDFFSAPQKRIIHRPIRIHATKAVENIAAQQFGGPV
jgi:hypothetical protein